MDAHQQTTTTAQIPFIPILCANIMQMPLSLPSFSPRPATRRCRHPHKATISSSSASLCCCCDPAAGLFHLAAAHFYARSQHSAFSVRSSLVCLPFGSLQTTTTTMAIYVGWTAHSLHFGCYLNIPSVYPGLPSFSLSLLFFASFAAR